jgi:hypothetical protein
MTDDHVSFEEKMCISRNETVKSRLDGMDVALGVRAQEIERRLEGLNQLRNEVVKDRDLFIRKDVFYQHQDAQNKQYEEIEKRLSLHDTRITIIETRAVVWTAAIAMFFTIVQVLMRFWK